MLAGYVSWSFLCQITECWYLLWRSSTRFYHMSSILLCISNALVTILTTHATFCCVSCHFKFGHIWSSSAFACFMSNYIDKVAGLDIWTADISCHTTTTVPANDALNGTSGHSKRWTNLDKSRVNLNAKKIRWELNSELWMLSLSNWNELWCVVSYWI